MRIIDCGVIGFHRAVAMQESLAAAIAAGIGEETLLLLEHPPVYTIGSGGDTVNILHPSIAAERTNRGGDVTWHGPGQLVGYPLFNLGRRGRDLHRWLRFLEELMIVLLASFGVEGWRQADTSGVWCAGGKIGFIGVGVRRWVSMHGFCLNVHPDLSAYARINPCGIPACPVTSLARECAFPPPTGVVRDEVILIFERFLDETLPLQPSPPPAPPAGRGRGATEKRLC